MGISVIKLTLTSAVVILAAAAMADESPQTDKWPHVEAVRDYIAVAELDEVDRIRYHRKFAYEPVNDHFVTARSRNDYFLVEFVRRCSDLQRYKLNRQIPSDVRRNSRHITAGFDTLYGCRIEKIYEISEAQRDELHELGASPGEEEDSPDDKES